MAMIITMLIDHLFDAGLLRIEWALRNRARKKKSA